MSASNRPSPITARTAFCRGRPVLLAAESLMRKIHREFKYAPGTTNIRTSASEAFETRRGVCQDFSHIMIAVSARRGAWPPDT